jgi:hypothetical protein
MSAPSSSRSFAYNPGSPIYGTLQIGNIAVESAPLDYSTGPGGVDWWQGPNELLGYVIAKPVESGSQPTPVLGKTAYIAFSRSTDLTDLAFIKLANNITNYSQNFTDATIASAWLTANGYWNSYVTPVLSLDASTYSGSGPWIDSIGLKEFSLINGPSWSSSAGGYFEFITDNVQYAECSTSLPDLNMWSVGVWHYYNGTEIGGNPCIVTEIYPGQTGQINYSIGTNNGAFSSGFFNGGWAVTGTYSLTAGNWYYIVGTYDGHSLNLYVNGGLSQTAEYAATPISSQGGIRLMSRWDYLDVWGGYLAKVDIYDKALTGSQVSSLWNLNRSRFEL